MEKIFNSQFNTEKGDYLNYLGYSEKTGYIFVLIFSIFSILMNIIFILNYILKKLFNKKLKKISSLEQILFILAILESIVSLLWFISAVKYPKMDKMQTISGESVEVCTGCKIVGSLLAFFYIFDWVLSGFALYHLKSMIINPINFILKSFKKIMLYAIISGISALGITILSYFSKMIGISPMISCFFTLNDTNTTQKIFIIIFVFIPALNLIFFLIEVIIVVTNPSYKTDSENRTLFKNHCIYTLINYLMNLLMSSLYIIYWVKGNEGVKNEAVSWYFYLVTLMICFNPLLVGLIRLYQTGILKMLCYKPNKKSNEGPLLENEENETQLNIESFEADAVKKFVMNIFISVCYCLEKSVKLSSNDCKIDEDICKETNEYIISKSEIAKDLSIVNLTKDILVKSREDFSISCVEYAPQIFAYLRRLDMIKEEEIIQSLLPKNNKNGIQDSEGRGGSFFLNTDDNEFSIKTITFGEAELIRSMLLCRMAEYLSSNKESIIGRVYGVYKISMKTGLFIENEIYFILMKNVIASFAAENLICKYDLKGSSLNRKVNLGEFVTKVMKDNNFKEVEQVLLLNKENSQKLLKVASEDANFFCKVKVMDYSLLVAKIALNNDEIEDLFGKFHRRKSEIQYFEMAGIKTDSNTDVALNIKENEENEKLIEHYHKNKEEEIKNIRYKRNKIKPLKKYFFPSLKGDVLYIIAIIDFFQLYNLQKTLETQMKLLKKGVKKKDISSMPPEGYKDRFIEFVKSITNSEKYVKEINDPENKNDFM